jgi:hypothetical protein
MSLVQFRRSKLCRLQPVCFSAEFLVPPLPPVDLSAEKDEHAVNPATTRENTHLSVNWELTVG